MTNEILKRLHFQEMALRFLDGMNPQPDRALVIADAICSYDGPLDTRQPMRYLAHDFLWQAIPVIERRQGANNGAFAEWLRKWNETYGVGND